MQTHASVKNTCTGLWPWLQEVWQQDLGREDAPEAKVRCGVVLFILFILALSLTHTHCSILLSILLLQSKYSKAAGTGTMRV